MYFKRKIKKAKERKKESYKLLGFLTVIKMNWNL